MDATFKVDTNNSGKGDNGKNDLQMFHLFWKSYELFHLFVPIL